MLALLRTTARCACIGVSLPVAWPPCAWAQQEGAPERRPPSAASCQVITAEDLADEHSVARALSARVTGLQLMATSGQAGAGSRVSMRGVNSLRDGQPLVFVDGLLMSHSEGAGQAMTVLDQLNPSDVLLIEIFRGPAATTLYGTQASGGVIRVFTKQGTPSAAGLDDPRAQCVP